MIAAICTPIFDTRENENSRAVESLIHGLGWEEIFEQPGNPVHSARSRIANRFLATGLEWSFWIDADMVFSPPEAVAFLERAIARNAEIQVAPYAARDGSGRRIEDGLGFALVRRGVYEKLREHPDMLRPLDLGGGVHGVHYFADCVRDGALMSEDRGFFVRAAEAGCKRVVDHRIAVGHKGKTVCWLKEGRA